jgi:hypothetical protein
VRNEHGAVVDRDLRRGTQTADALPLALGQQRVESRLARSKQRTDLGQPCRLQLRSINVDRKVERVESSARHVDQLLLVKRLDHARQRQEERLPTVKRLAKLDIELSVFRKRNAVGRLPSLPLMAAPCSKTGGPVTTRDDLESSPVKL